MVPIASYMLYYQRLYSLGARKIVVVNVGPIGCIPYLRDTQNLGGSGCVALANQLAQGFNTKLKDLVADLSKNLEGSLFVYADAYRIVNDIVSNYKSYGITKIFFHQILLIFVMVLNLFSSFFSALTVLYKHIFLF